ncbi:restriction endonuclease [Rhodoferax sp.]|uniref:restriction endonuclease n=1 Tax=Rhodoferax sp. TaxID=50421 RepID=UPI0025D4EE95|nr:restriction endonuclease [Rhodoferax sp.]
MKLKMAKNSLFAVLLRSPWWVSMLLVLVFGLLSFALLPKAYIPFGLLGTMPFLVIGVIAASRQWDLPSTAKVNDMLAQATAMPWREFADALDAAYRAKGYTVARLNGKAADLLLSKDGQTTLVAAKRWKAANHGVEALRELAAAKEAQSAAACVYISIGGVTDTALQFAKERGITLVADVALAQLLLQAAK